MKIWRPNQPLQDGRLIIQEVLGGGGYGVTYSTIEQRTGKLFVLKTLNHLQQSQADFQQRQVKFVNEALRLAKCSHPHIVQVYEVIEEDGLWGMVMEYIDGQDLAAYIDERGQLPEDEALRYIDSVGQALEYVHQRGFLHRDVKPSNILLSQGTQEAVLIDFGLAREFTMGKTGSMTDSLTEGYAPIEQYERRGNFGAYTDVYALAATLYALLTAEMPLPAIYRKYATLPPPKQHNPRISDRVSDAIVKGMALSPQEPPQTVQEWLELLMPKKANSPIVQPSIPNPKSSASNPKRQNPILNFFFPNKESNDITLITARMDYTRLRDLLAVGKWREADEETTRVMLAVAGREEESWLRFEDIDNFPCKDLRTIDQLWVEYSDGRFGFSVQKRIYQSLAGTREYDQESDNAFGDRVGWRKKGVWMYYEDLTYDITAPTAHLPSFGLGVNCRWERYENYSISSLAWKLVKCNI